MKTLRIAIGVAAVLVLVLAFNVTLFVIHPLLWLAFVALSGLVQLAWWGLSAAKAE